MREAAFGCNHPDVTSEIHIMAAIHHDTKRYETAIALYGTALAIRERARTESFRGRPDVRGPPAARRDAGEPEEAELLVSRAEEIRRHPRDAADQDPSPRRNGDSRLSTPAHHIKLPSDGNRR